MSAVFKVSLALLLLVIFMYAVAWHQADEIEKIQRDRFDGR